MIPTNKENLLNKLSVLYNQKDYESLLDLSEDYHTSAPPKEELDYYIYLYVLKAHYELEQYDEALKLILLAMDYRHKYAFNDTVLNNDDKKGMYFWDMMLTIAKAKEGKYGMLKVQKDYEEWTKRTLPQKDTPNLLAEMRMWFGKKILYRAKLCMILPICTIILLGIFNKSFEEATINFLGIKDHKMLQRLYFMLLIPLGVLSVMKKTLYPITDQLMLFWIRTFKKDMLKPTYHKNTNTSS